MCFLGTRLQRSSFCGPCPWQLGCPLAALRGPCTATGHPQAVRTPGEAALPGRARPYGWLLPSRLSLDTLGEQLRGRQSGQGSPMRERKQRFGGREGPRLRGQSWSWVGARPGPGGDSLASDCPPRVPVSPQHWWWCPGRAGCFQFIDVTREDLSQQTSNGSV